jgi:uncharacterized membrane protein
MTDNPLSKGPQDPDPQNPYAQGVPGQPQPGYGQQPPVPPQPGYGEQPPVPPQQPGAYPAPGAPGGYPATPQPGYGQQPGGYPPPSPYGQVSPQVSIGDAFSYGWNKFTSNAGVVIGGFLTWGAGFVIISGLFFALLIGSLAVTYDPYTGTSSGGFGFGITTILFMIVVMALGYLAQAAMINVASVASSGRKVEFKDFFSFPNFGTVVLLALSIGAASGILSFTWIGSLAVAVFSQFMLFFAVDQRQSFADSVTNGWNLVTKNLGVSILVYLVVLLCTFVGSLLCGVGLLVAIPVAMFTTAYVYRRLIGQQPA